MDITKKEFDELVKIAMNDIGCLRIGQSFFSELYNRNKELAEEITGTSCDPFYDDENLYNFYTKYCK